MKYWLRRKKRGEHLLLMVIMKTMIKEKRKDREIKERSWLWNEMKWDGIGCLVKKFLLVFAKLCSLKLWTSRKDWNWAEKRRSNWLFLMNFRQINFWYSNYFRTDDQRFVSTLGSGYSKHRKEDTIRKLVFTILVNVGSEYGLTKWRQLKFR